MQHKCLAGEMGRTDPGEELMFSPMGPTAKTNEVPFAPQRANPAKQESRLQPAPQKPLTFQTAGRQRDFTLSHRKSRADESRAV